MRGVAPWLLGGSVSLAFHGAAVLVLPGLWAPDPVEDQPMPEAKLEMTTYEVARGEAVPREAEGEAAPEANTTGVRARQDVVPVVRAEPFAPEISQAATAPIEADRIAPAAAPAATKADLPDADALAAAAPAPVVLAAAEFAGGDRPNQITPEGAPLLAAPPPSVDTPPSDIPGERATATLAWSGDGDAIVDPVSIAAIQSFMEPGDAAASQSNAGDVRDAIGQLLASVPCARLQAAFIPESGALELRGHVPEEGLRGPVLDALRAQIGDAIPVTDNVLILPRPQCGALSGIAAAGLPQSTDQDTDERLVGENAHAREYAYAEGERLTFDLVTPDYPAFVYVDFFDADGNVVHLVPSEYAALSLLEPASRLVVGADTGAAAFRITVGPPFGQEIAAAFAASSRLSDAPRPVVEPAGPYLDWLRNAVAVARAQDPDFKGEWVYFFISTMAASN
ncbi:DUF4384 domain-containing protein [Defluviimonas sp. WL0002]|uniref:DUF4384 domain-containing protein n=1 Tax=Albidovulum marisflavi TaxID=2984159 RepID=A0ABT2ZDQ4_9RHOB|nr:DUF4384 domain-containing protein [Defluviimonas sp. WL0002]MCV2869211.1 DUF4384 domain-containing protein [Defluviimonas sp. WL0002]